MAEEAALSADAKLLLERAHAAKWAVDLYLSPGAIRITADRLIEIMHSVAPSELGERALWNLLFAAGELSLRVDIYRAHDLFRAATSLIARVAALAPSAGDPRAVAIEMGFDFFFARPNHPLLPLRAREVLGALSTLLGSGHRSATRAAIHGLGHLVVLGGDNGARASVTDEALLLLEEYLGGRVGPPPDETLAAYAEEARSGALR